MNWRMGQIPQFPPAPELALERIAGPVKIPALTLANDGRRWGMDAGQDARAMMRSPVGWRARGIESAQNSPKSRQGPAAR